MSTKEKLAQALIEAKAPPAMIAAARKGAYDDYQSKSATPINDLMRDAKRYGLTSIVAKAMNGDFDSTKEEAEEWAKSPEGQATIKEFNRGAYK